MDLGVELEFSDGKHVVDTAIADLIKRATSGHPEGFTFEAALALVGPQHERDILRGVQQRVVSEHLRQYGG